MTIEDIKEFLQQINFPSAWITDQTALSVLALLDANPRQGLLPGHSSLSEGARIHDILNYVRKEFGRRVAENTRESYRKLSLRPLMQAGLVIRHQLSTNDPNTYYRLHPDFYRLLLLSSGSERDKLIEQLRLGNQKRSMQKANAKEDVLVTFPAGESYTLSPGIHNLLEKAIVEIMAPALLQNPQVVYLGDTAPRVGYQNRSLMRRLNLPIDVSVALPDVILYGTEEQTLLIIEAVHSSGPLNMGRLSQMQVFASGPASLAVTVVFISAFPSRQIFRRFVEGIAWGSSVWIANEPYNLIHFVPLSSDEGISPSLPRDRTG